MEFQIWIDLWNEVTIKKPAIKKLQVGLIMLALPAADIYFSSVIPLLISIRQVKDQMT